MTADLPHVVVPYAEFLARRERRSRIASERGRLGTQPAPGDVEPVAVSDAKPEGSRQELQAEAPPPEKQPEPLSR